VTGLPIFACNAQSASATLTGTVVDATGAVLTGVDLALVDADTADRRALVSKGDGSFGVRELPPGGYRLMAPTPGFQATAVHAHVLNVGDRLHTRVDLRPAAIAERITVVAGGGRINPSPCVGTGIDRQFVRESSADRTDAAIPAGPYARRGNSASAANSGHSA
jgi:hypothetical protein